MVDFARSTEGLSVSGSNCAFGSSKAELSEPLDDFGGSNAELSEPKGFFIGWKGDFTGSNDGFIDSTVGFTICANESFPISSFLHTGVC